ncbi:MAG: hypothetical protein J3K34DRAFT_409308 [Monoraphidium minutum]|nr:MAG: hypothetical protein J3K34DRAFT_409308 [Monoraphidium minutum]
MGAAAAIDGGWWCKARVCASCARGTATATLQSACRRRHAACAGDESLDEVPKGPGSCAAPCARTSCAARATWRLRRGRADGLRCVARSERAARASAGQQRASAGAADIWGIQARAASPFKAAAHPNGRRDAWAEVRTTPRRQHSWVCMLPGLLDIQLVLDLPDAPS